MSKICFSVLYAGLCIHVQYNTLIIKKLNNQSQGMGKILFETIQVHQTRQPADIDSCGHWITLPTVLLGHIIQTTDYNLSFLALILVSAEMFYYGVKHALWGRSLGCRCSIPMLWYFAFRHIQRLFIWPALLESTVLWTVTFKMHEIRSQHHHLKLSNVAHHCNKTVCNSCSA